MLFDAVDDETVTGLCIEEERNPADQQQWQQAEKQHPARNPHPPPTLFRCFWRPLRNDLVDYVVQKACPNDT